MTSSIDAAEVEQFARLAERWWDEHGEFKPLHQINPVRIAYMKEHICRHFGRDATQITALEGLSLLDIGCGGGLISEPMARLGAEVTGVDAAEKNIKTATLHAAQSGLDIHYRAATAEALAAEGACFDVVLALEIIEHVVDPLAFIDSCATLVKPGGLLIMSTINRSAKAFALAIIGAEYVLRMLPRGTHNFRKFVKPEEMMHGFTRNGFSITDCSGMVLDPLRWRWRIDPSDTKVNYLMVAAKPNL